MRQEAAHKRQERLIEELWLAWKGRNFALVHRIRHQLAAKGRGARRRNYHSAAQGAPAMEEWEATLRLPGGEGGMCCETFDWNSHCKKYTDDVETEARAPTPITAEISDKIWEDNKAMTKQLRHMGKRRAYPDWSMPAEIWLQLLRPNWRQQSEWEQGIGREARIRNPNFQLCWTEFMSQIRQRGRVPLEWSKGKAHPLEKGVGKMGTAGKGSSTSVARSAVHGRW